MKLHIGRIGLARRGLTALIGPGLLAALLMGQPSQVAALGSGSVDTQLTLFGNVPPSEIHQLFFEDPAAHLSQTLFTICGGAGPACAATRYLGQMSQLPDGSAFTFRFERIASDGTRSIYFQGTGVVGQVPWIRAEYGYGTVPNTAAIRLSHVPVWPIAVGMVGLTLLVALRRMSVLR